MEDKDGTWFHYLKNLLPAPGAGHTASRRRSQCKSQRTKGQYVSLMSNATMQGLGASGLRIQA
jgi:hypothetical protein